MYKTRATDTGVKELIQLKSLLVLDLSDTAVTDAGLKELKGLKSLLEVHLKGTKVTDAMVEELLEASRFYKLVR
jgi:hypothetical protein